MKLIDYPAEIAEKQRQLLQFEQRIRRLQDLIRVGEDCISRSSERIRLKHINQRPSIVSTFHLRNRHKRRLGHIRLSVEDKSRKECHGSLFNECL